MRIKQKVKFILKNLIRKNKPLDFMAECLSAICGNSKSVANIVLFASENILSLNDTLFWDDLKDFIDGVDEHKDEYRFQLSAKLVEKDDKMRLLKIIREVQSKQQVKYIVNATRCFLAGFIEKDVYFRLCYLISSTLVEDLLFLQKHISDEEREYVYGINVQGLESIGLMYLSTISGGTASNEYNPEDGNKYSFTNVAYVLDEYSLSYDDDARYPNPKKNHHG